MRENQKPNASQLNLQKNRCMPGYKPGNKVGYPKTSFVKMRICLHQPSTPDSNRDGSKKYKKEKDRAEH